MPRRKYFFPRKPLNIIKRMGKAPQKTPKETLIGYDMHAPSDWKESLGIHHARTTKYNKRRTNLVSDKRKKQCAQQQWDQRWAGARACQQCLARTAINYKINKGNYVLGVRKHFQPNCFQFKKRKISRQVPHALHYRDYSTTFRHSISIQTIWNALNTSSMPTTAYSKTRSERPAQFYVKLLVDFLDRTHASAHEANRTSDWNRKHSPFFRIHSLVHLFREEKKIVSPSTDNCRQSVFVANTTVGSNHLK